MFLLYSVLIYIAISSRYTWTFYSCGLWTQHNGSLRNIGFSSEGGVVGCCVNVLCLECMFMWRLLRSNRLLFIGVQMRWWSPKWFLVNLWIYVSHLGSCYGCYKVNVITRLRIEFAGNSVLLLDPVENKWSADNISLRYSWPSETIQGSALWIFNRTVSSQIEKAHDNYRNFHAWNMDRQELIIPYQDNSLRLVYLFKILSKRYTETDRNVLIWEQSTFLNHHNSIFSKNIPWRIWGIRIREDESCIIF